MHVFPNPVTYITTSQLKVVLLNIWDPENPGPHTIIEREFTRKVIPSQSMWSIEKATSVGAHQFGKTPGG